MVREATDDEFEQHQFLQAEKANWFVPFTDEVRRILYDGVPPSGARPDETLDARFFQRQLAHVHRRRQQPLADPDDIEHDALTIITNAVELVLYHWREVGVGLSEVFEQQAIHQLLSEDRERFGYRGEDPGRQRSR